MLHIKFIVKPCIKGLKLLGENNYEAVGHTPHEEVPGSAVQMPVAAHTTMEEIYMGIRLPIASPRVFLHHLVKLSMGFHTEIG